MAFSLIFYGRLRSAKLADALNEVRATYDNAEDKNVQHHKITKNPQK